MKILLILLFLTALAALKSSELHTGIVQNVSAVSYPYQFWENFESGNLSLWDQTQEDVPSDVQITSAAAAEEKYGLSINTAGGYGDYHERIVKNITPENEYYFRVRFKLLQDLVYSDHQGIVWLSTGGLYGNAVGGIALRNLGVGQEEVFNSIGSVYWDTGYHIVPNTWYCAEVHGVVGSGTGRVTTWINGQQISDFTNIDTGSAPIQNIIVGPGWPQIASQYYFDDLVVDQVNSIGCGTTQPFTGPNRTNTTPQTVSQSTSSTQLTLTTDTDASCKYDTVIGTSYDSMPDTFSTTGGTSHATTVTGLQSGQIYSYYVRCKDSLTGAVNNTDLPITFKVSVDKTTVNALTLKATYENISVYSPFSGDEDNNNSVQLQWRKVGDTTWKTGMSMWKDTRKTLFDGTPNQWYDQYRGSILGVKPNTFYEVQVTYTDPDGIVGTNPVSAIITTRNDQYPSTGNTYYVSPSGSDSNSGTQASPFATIQKAVNLTQAGDTVMVEAGTYQGQVDIANSGTATNYITIRTYGTDHVVLDASTSPYSCGPGTDGTQQCGVFISGSYIHLNGFEIINGWMGVKVGRPGHDVILDHLYLHGQYQPPNNMGETILVGDSFNSQNPVASVTIQNSRITSTTPDPASDIVLFMGSSGGHVVRNNVVYDAYPGASGLHGTDCFGGLPNEQWQGGYFADSDLYNNDCVNSTDDSIEVDGGNMNTRIYNNKISGGNNSFSVAPTIIGPSYIFRNVAYNFTDHWIGSCLTVKTGESGNGGTFFYHNTWYAADPSIRNRCPSNILGIAGYGSAGGSTNMYFGDNIIHVLDRVYSSDHGDEQYFPDYNLLWTDSTQGGVFAKYQGQFYGSFSSFVSSTGLDKHSVNQRPVYVNEANNDFHLAPGSPGIDQGTVIPGFDDADSSWPYTGSAPDMGAYESGLTTQSVIGLSDPSQVPLGDPLGSSVTPTPTLGNGDANGDGVVNSADILLVLQNWLSKTTGSIDQYTDGLINSMDFVRVVGQMP